MKLTEAEARAEAGVIQQARFEMSRLQTTMDARASILKQQCPHPFAKPIIRHGGQRAQCTICDAEVRMRSGQWALAS